MRKRVEQLRAWWWYHSGAVAFVALIGLGWWGFRQSERVDKDLAARVVRDSLQDAQLAAERDARVAYEVGRAKADLAVAAQRDRQLSELRNALLRRAAIGECRRTNRSDRAVNTWADTLAAVTGTALVRMREIPLQVYFDLVARTDSANRRLARATRPADCPRAYAERVK